MGSLATLEVFGSRSGLTASKKTMSFVTNHDTDRNGPYLSYKDGARYKLANKWLLAQGYGSPQVYSSFTWATGQPAGGRHRRRQGGKTQSPSEPTITNTNCSSGQWTCDHRDRGIVAMIGWHQYVGSAKRANWYTDDFNVIAFSKGNRGWAAFNNGTDGQAIRCRPGCRREPTATSSPAAAGGSCPGLGGGTAPASRRSPCRRTRRLRSSATVGSDR